MASNTTNAANHEANNSKPPLQPGGNYADRTVRLTARDDGICVLTFDRPGSSANIFDARTLNEVAQELDFVARQTELKGLVLISAKPRIFIVGADLKSLREDAEPAEVRGFLELGQSVMNRIAALRIPTVAAIHGAAVGGGYEIGLACDYRIASPARDTNIGLPETMIGLLPAWGGSTRLPRLIGLPKALDIILGGKTVPAKKALRLGMIDEIAPVEYLLASAIRKIGAGKPARPSHWLTNNFVAASLIEKRVRKTLLRKTRGNYPSVLKALEVAAHGVSSSIEDSLALERDGVLELVRTSACHNLIRVFFLQERAKKLDVPLPESTADLKPVRSTAVIGAGVMGAGIAQWISARQLPVILRDINAEQVAKGLATAAKLYQDAVKRRLFTEHEARRNFERIQPAPTEVPLHHTDIVIEAAVEKLELKKKIFQRLGEISSQETILATNTSALPVSEIADFTRHPERVVGLHFFNPVHRMQLVEVVAAKATSPEVLQRAARFTRQLGKLPVVVRDSPGFLVNRVLMPYLIEAVSLFETGAPQGKLDEVMLDFGMPMGPLRLLDEVGLDVAMHVAETLAVHYRDRIKIPECLPRMIAAGLLGRKIGRGFYLHNKGKRTTPNPQAAIFVMSLKHRALSREELQERMVFLMINEAARCLEEKIVTEAADVDFAMIMGTGFAPFRGGPLRHADAVGATRLAGAMDHLVLNGAAHFAPCDLLAQMARQSTRFYEKA